MITRIASRISAAVILGMALHVFDNYTNIKFNEMGKSAFLTSQSDRFDKFYANPPSPLAPGRLFSGLLLAGAFLGAYEVLAFGIYTVIKPKAGPDGT